MVTDVFCGYRDLTLVIQKPECPLEDKLQSLFWLGLAQGE